MNKKLVLKLSLAATIGFTYLAAPSAAFAAPDSESEFDQKLTELSGTQSDAEKELEVLVSEIESKEKEMSGLINELEKTTTVLTQLQSEIEELNTVIEEREERLEEQARAVQVTGDSGSMVNFLMDSESLSDIIGRLDVVSTIVSANQDLIQKQLEDKESVVEKEKETMLKQEEQTMRAAKMESQKIELEEKKANQERLVASIAAERAEVAEDKEVFLAQLQAAEQKVQEIQTARTAAAETSTISVSDETNDAETTVSTSSSEPAVQEEKTEKTVPAPVAGGSMISTAHSLTGVPYSWGGGTPAGFDCSGFVQYVLRKAGRSITRTAAGQYSSTTRISQSQAQPGDLIFFNQSGSIDHVGIYLGGGKFIGAQTSTGVAVASFTSGYWSRYVAGFGRP